MRELCQGCGFLQDILYSTGCLEGRACNTCKVVKRMPVAGAGESNHLVHNQCFKNSRSNPTRWFCSETVKSRHGPAVGEQSFV